MRIFANCCTLQAKLAEPLDKSHTVISVAAGPELLGWPVRRNRTLSAGISKATATWLGPVGADLQADFEEFFSCALQLTGDVFLVAKDEEIIEEQNKLASLRGLRATRVLKGANSSVYTPGQILRFEDYAKKRDEQAKRTGKQQGAYFADLEQHCARGSSTPGPLIPTQLTHGTIHAFSSDRIMLTSELFLAHGFNFFPEATGCMHGSRVAGFLRSLGLKQQRELLGNGWHLPTLAAWTMYVLSHTVRTNRVMSVRPELCLLKKGGSQFSLRSSKSTLDEPDGSQGSEQQGACSSFRSMNRLKSFIEDAAAN